MKIFPAGLLALACSLAAVVAQGGSPVPYKVQTPPLDTEWTYKVGTNPWPEHPRPQLQRDAWQSLNGIWTFQPAGPGDGDSGNPPDGPLQSEVLVPSCIESGLSGLQVINITDMWFATSFKIPHNWHGQNVILNFEAVDYQAVVFVNGARAGTHTGGYFRFGVDITKFVKFGGDNSVAVFVHDPTDLDVIPIGKQTRNPSHIFYRSCSGIWQSVWLESVPSNHITQLDIAAGMDGTVSVTVHSSNKQGVSAKVSVIGLDGRIIASQKGPSDEEFKFKVKQPKLWSPSSPTLYNLTVTLGDDEVSSYTGFRTISTGKVKGIQRPLLNGEFTFIFGTLDQGFWPDGLYTPPNREAMVYDLKMLKGLGFNAVRKHIKVEPDLFYRACDEMGLMVIQDMPSLTNDGNRPPNPDQQAEFQRQLEILINEHKSYPSIVTWVIYNEGWGQLKGPPYPEFQLVEVVRGIDSTRLIDATTGWNDHGAADYSDNHHYANPQCGTPFYSTPSSPYDPNRIGFQGEFGGIGHNVSIEHLWNVQQAINTINQTYEVNADLVSYNYRASVLFREFREQVERYACSGGIWTQTTDVEGEVNGLYTYDRRVLRPDPRQWISDINKLYSAAAGRR
ncbi:glycoside hydrolase family 2 protein [Trichoderma virens Gv29-8]|uniref:Glycoside hydrolase family 2 protein n=1 Tax=Hypocrea virens (strain Gv29-8 / FGSC 10586) TaxID=413071 RepID=G9MRB7_HYPVG|nr:glycoside hydrolase family 2 protein [Trichoderma virens Gv29-8]EHK22641.1 glycoside hydrolase family 2 protein [Trichoderma virens Gv29-8]